MSTRQIYYVTCKREEIITPLVNQMRIDFYYATGQPDETITPLVNQMRLLRHWSTRWDYYVTGQPMRLLRHLSTRWDYYVTGQRDETITSLVNQIHLQLGRGIHIPMKNSNISAEIIKIAQSDHMGQSKYNTQDSAELLSFINLPVPILINYFISHRTHHIHVISHSQYKPSPQRFPWHTCYIPV